MRKISALVLAVLLLVSVLPMGLLASAETPTAIDGTFESATVGETPDGWTLVSTNQGGGAYDERNFGKFYKLTVESDVKFSGEKALCITAYNNGTYTTQGYVVAQSPAISVTANTKYYFDHTIKTSAVTNETNYYGGRVFLVEYDANGVQVKRGMIGTALAQDTDWTNRVIEYTTTATTATVKLEFYLGGPNGEEDGKNGGAKFYIDDVYFATTVNAPPMDGTFEGYATGSVPKGWIGLSVQTNGDYNTSNYQNNYNIKVTTDDKNSGSKSMAITSATSNGGMYGYMVVQSPAIDVAGGKLHILKYAMKLQGIDEGAVANSDIYGGKTYLVQYDAEGNQIARQRVGDVYYEDTEWTVTNLGITVAANAVTAKVEFFIGGRINWHQGFVMLVDDVSFAEPKLDGTFESYTTDEFPLGWTTQSTEMNGTYSTTSYQNKYVVSIVTDDKYSGNKALSIAHKDTTGGVYGYFVAQTPKIEVTPGVEYTLKFARKITGVDAVTNFFASRVYVAQYNAEGTQIARGQVGNSLGANCDWTVNTEKITVRQNAAYVVLEFYSGSHRDQNVAATILIDDLDFFTCTNHVYDNNCDEDCNECGAIREAPHDYANACDTECDTCFETREAAHEYTDACDAECNKCQAPRTAPHSWDNDCDEDCNLCGTPRTVTHQYDGECDAECNACGDTRQVNASHTFANDCDTECDVCHATRHPVADHQYTDACDTNCNVCQAPRTAPHDYDSECDTKCNLCEETRTTTVQHDWDEGTVTKPADCKDKGEKTFTCNDCKETKTEEIDKTGHTLGGWTTVQPAGCENGGTEKRECSKCDYEETRETTALGHDFGEPTVTEPTCTNDGIKETACSRCDEKEIEVLEATGHNYGDWEITKEATETEKGTKTKTCEICGDKKTEDIPKLAPTDTDADKDDDGESAGFPWYYVAIPVAAVLVLVIIIVVIAKSRKK